MEIVLTEIEKLIDDNRLDEALLQLENIGEPNNLIVHVCLLKGRIYQKQQRLGDAINEYSKVLEVDPENSLAKTGIEMAHSILEFFHPDMYNP